MKFSALTILNALGCLILTGLVLTLWTQERGLNHTLGLTRAALTAAEKQLAEETLRAAALERDITVLKESIEATQNSAEAAARTLAEKDTLTSGLQDEVTAARQQLTTWQAAITERDAKLITLSAELTATRQRLDSAIAKLKTAAAR